MGLTVALSGLVDAGPFRSNGRVVHGTGSAGIASPKTLVETLKIYFHKLIHGR